MRTLLTFLLTFFPALVLPQDSTAIREFDLRTVSKLGRDIYRIDQHAARATDILFEQGLELQRYPIRGWVVTEDKDGVLVTFVGEYENEMRGVFEIRPESMASNRFRNVEGRDLTSEESSRFNARQIAAEAVTEPCSEKYNTVVIPDPEDELWLVYLLAATTEPDLILAGGHYRYTVSQDGTTLLQSDRLSNSCLALDKSGTDTPAGAVTVMKFLTHKVSSTPIETHVFLSLLHEMEFAVITPDKVIWQVSGDQVSRLEP
jgi:hypothetical protein